MSIYITASNILKNALCKKGTVKTLVYSSQEKDKRKLFALVCETLKHQSVLFQILEETDLLRQTGWSEDTYDQIYSIESSLGIDQKYLAITLLYDYLFGKGLGKAGRIRSLITKHKRLILTTFSKFKSDNNIRKLLEVNKDIISLPRYVRINTIKTTKEDIIQRFQQDGWILKTDYDTKQYCQILQSLCEFEFVVDPIIPNLLAFPPRTDFHSHYLNESGAIILQDRASCFPVHVLNPPSGSHVIDCCAAPGNKTTHLAAVMNNTGKILAFDLSKERINTLERFVNKAEVTNTSIRCTDFMKVDPSIKGCERVEYILVDPSCSGSGIAERRNDLTDDVHSKTKKRLSKLSGFQSLILQHALSFPSAKRVVYSTCSVHEEENEKVVDEVYRKFQDLYELEYILPDWDVRGKDGYVCSKTCIRLNTTDHLTNGFFLASFVSKHCDLQNEITTIKYEENDVQYKKQKDNSLEITVLDGLDSKKRKCPEINEDELENSKNRKKKKKYNKGDKLNSEELYDIDNSVTKHRKKKKHKGDNSSSKALCDVDNSVTKNRKNKKKHKVDNLSSQELCDKDNSDTKKKKHNKGGNLNSQELCDMDNSVTKHRKKKKHKGYNLCSEELCDIDNSITENINRTHHSKKKTKCKEENNDSFEETSYKVNPETEDINRTHHSKKKNKHQEIESLEEISNTDNSVIEDSNQTHYSKKKKEKRRHKKEN